MREYPGNVNNPDLFTPNRRTEVSSKTCLMDIHTTKHKKHLYTVLYIDVCVI